jgi:hypothetical protein
MYSEHQPTSHTHTFTVRLHMIAYLHPILALTCHVVIIHLETILGIFCTEAVAPPNHVRTWTACL